MRAEDDRVVEVQRHGPVEFQFGLRTEHLRCLDDPLRALRMAGRAIGGATLVGDDLHAASLGRCGGLPEVLISPREFSAARAPHFGPNSSPSMSRTPKPLSRSPSTVTRWLSVNSSRRAFRSMANA